MTRNDFIWWLKKQGCVNGKCVWVRNIKYHNYDLFNRILGFSQLIVRFELRDEKPPVNYKIPFDDSACYFDTKPKDSSYIFSFWLAKSRKESIEEFVEYIKGKIQDENLTRRD